MVANITKYNTVSIEIQLFLTLNIFVMDNNCFKVVSILREFTLIFFANGFLSFRAWLREIKFYTKFRAKNKQSPGLLTLPYFPGYSGTNQ